MNKTVYVQVKQNYLLQDKLQNSTNMSKFDLKRRKMGYKQFKVK